LDRIRQREVRGDISMHIGIGLPNQVRDVRASVIPQWAAQAESAGFSTLGTVGRMAYPGVIDTVALAAAAGATSTIGLLTTVLLGPTWPGALLAKEAAGIDGVSGGRLRLGLGIGNAGPRGDDFVVAGLPARGLGKRIDADLETYRSVWRGEPFGGGPNPGVPAGTREVPLLFGGSAAASFERMARWGQGYVAGGMPAPMVAEPFEQARNAWQAAGRDGSPQLVAVAYFVFGDVDKGRANVRNYYIAGGEEFGDMVANGVHAGADAVRAAVRAFEEIGTDELILHPALDDVDEVAKLADAVL
jgi:alkanesulfonate monooxygenase SsuD/methylene tetrahydromethanopterin reductase-like flavin-dependent oxidoreductase (luciferase family)